MRVSKIRRQKGRGILRGVFCAVCGLLLMTVLGFSTLAADTPWVTLLPDGGGSETEEPSNDRETVTATPISEEKSRLLTDAFPAPETADPGCASGIGQNGLPLILALASASLLFKPCISDKHAKTNDLKGRNP